MERLVVNKNILTNLTPFVDSKTNKQYEGSTGKLYQLRPGVLFKLYKKYEPIIIKKDKEYIQKELELTNYHQLDFEKLRTLEERQSKISSVDFPIGYGIYEGGLVGVIVKEYKNCISLYNYFCNKPEEFKTILNKIVLMIEELSDNYIYNTDVHIDNFVVDKTGIPHMIDVDGNYFQVNNFSSPRSLSDVCYYIKTIITDYAKLMNLININLREQIDSLPNTIQGVKQSIEIVEYKRKRLMR